jgi:hypothetical protein
MAHDPSAVVVNGLFHHHQGRRILHLVLLQKGCRRIRIQGVKDSRGQVFSFQRFLNFVHFLSRERKTNQKKTPVRRFFPVLLAGCVRAVKLAALKQSQLFFPHPAAMLGAS